MDTKRKAQAIAGLQKMEDKASALKSLGYTASDLKSLGYTASDLKSLGYTASDLKSLGYTASALISAGYTASALISAGYTASDLKSLGYTASDLISLGYTASALISAGYTASALKSAGYTASDLKSLGYTASDLKSAGYTASDLKSLGYTASDLKEWESIRVIEKPYTRLWNDIQAKRRKHNQSDWGPKDPPIEANVCGTAMCTAGHLVNMADAYDVLHNNNNDFKFVATLVHMKSTSKDLPMQDFGRIPQERALATIEWLAALEDENSPEHKEYFEGLKK